MTTRPCSMAGCPHLQPCPIHRRDTWAKRSTRSINGYEWQRRRQRVIDRDGGICTLRLPGCTVTATTADHIVGTAQGGSDDESNLRASCKSCNERRAREQSLAARPTRARPVERHPGRIG